jgi:hypothetical protein
MNTSNIPWVGENASKKYVFYTLCINDYGRLEDSYSSLCDSLQYAYSNNRWIFNQFIKFWGIYLENMEYDIMESPPLTNDEYIEYMQRECNHKVNCSLEFIWMDQLNTVDSIVIYVTGQMEEDANVANSESGDLMDCVFLDFIMGTKEFLKRFEDYLIDNEDLKVINKLIYKLSNVYVPLYVLLTNSCDFMDFPENWFLKLPDYLKMYFTKEADFPAPIETLTSADLTDSSYLVWYYLLYAYNYPGSLAYTDVGGCYGDDDNE